MRDKSKLQMKIKKRELPENRIIIRQLKRANKSLIGFSTAVGLHLFSISDLLCCEADGDSCKIHLMNRKEPLQVDKDLEFVSKFLPSKDYFRIHPSFLVRYDRIAIVNEKVVLVSGLALPICACVESCFMDHLREQACLVE